jgi:HK97 family phage prohead protease
MKRDNIIRAVSDGVTLGNGDRAPRVVGHFAVINEWTEIRSLSEGHFVERFSPGAFTKTISENRRNMRVLFQHGKDPAVGDKPLGGIEELREDGHGVYYEVGLLDAPYVRDNVVPGHRAGLYGASFRFKVIRDEVVDRPGRSEHNPAGLQERTIREAAVREFGPVTFPAYVGTTANVRSLTDMFSLPRRDVLQRELEQRKQLLRRLERDYPGLEAPRRSFDSCSRPSWYLAPSWYLGSRRRVRRYPPQRRPGQLGSVRPQPYRRKYGPRPK